MTSSFKAQPWKANWPPKEVDKSVPSHGCPQGAVLSPNGDTVSKPRNFTNLSSANNDESPSKAQPWKANWPPKEVDKSVPSHGCPQGVVLSPNGDTVSKPRNFTNLSAEATLKVDDLFGALSAINNDGSS